MKSYFLIAVGFLFMLSACGGDSPKAEAQTQTTETKTEDHGQAGVAAVEGEQANALQVAMSIPDFSTLVAAINAAGVQNAVVNTGPLTIFAPLNTAFDKLPEGTVATLVKPENKGKLAYILTNHVAPSNYGIKQLKKEAKKGRKLYMASGKYLVVENKEDGVYVAGTKILKTVKVSNGWIHVVDDVIVPSDK